MNGTGSGPVLPQAAACVNPQSSDAPTTISTDTQRSNHAVEAALRVGAVVEDDAMLTSAGAGARRAARSGGRDLISIAPMMEVTDRYYRTFMRHLTKHTKLYTEMVVDDTILHQRHNLERFLGYDEVQHPVAIQLGGDSAEKLSECSDICRQWGYDEINLNCGCPSKRVVSKCFGAKLMLDPEKVREITASMRRRALDCPVTVKCRLGADERDSYSDLCEFVATASQSGVKHFIVHARKCLLDGLSTKQNRVIPKLKCEAFCAPGRQVPSLSIVCGSPAVYKLWGAFPVQRSLPYHYHHHHHHHLHHLLLLLLRFFFLLPARRYHWVFKLCRDFPDLEFSLNGHVASIAEARALLQPIPVDIACDEQKLGEYLRKRTHDQENRLGASRRNTVLSIGLRGGSASGIGGGGGGGGAARQDLHNSELLSTSQGRVDMPPLLSSIERVCDDDVSVQGSVRLNSVMVGYVRAPSCRQ